MLFRPLSPKASDAAQFLPDVKINLRQTHVLIPNKRTRSLLRQRRLEKSNDYTTQIVQYASFF
jgi:hypothetical protein